MTTSARTFRACMYVDSPKQFWLFCSLIPVAGLGLVLLAIWWIDTQRKCLIIDDNKTIYREGLLFKNETYMEHHDVLSIFVSPIISIETGGTGTVKLNSKSNGLKSISISGIKNPIQIKQIIEQYRTDDCTATKLSTHSTVERVLDIAHLREQHVLSLKEFELLKARILEQVV